MAIHRRTLLSSIAPRPVGNAAVTRREMYARRGTPQGRVVSKFTQLCYATRAPFSVTVDEEFRSVVQVSLSPGDSD